jgi:hypothetical protein
VRLGEGYAGDFNPDDDDDEELLRFDVERQVDGDWEAVPCGSWCTLLPATSDPLVLRAGLALLLRELYEPVIRGEGIKTIAERLSSMDARTLEDTA